MKDDIEYMILKNGDVLDPKDECLINGNWQIIPLPLRLGQKFDIEINYPTRRLINIEISDLY